MSTGLYQGEINTGFQNRHRPKIAVDPFEFPTVWSIIHICSGVHKQHHPNLSESGRSVRLWY